MIQLMLLVAGFWLFSFKNWNIKVALQDADEYVYDLRG